VAFEGSNYGFFASEYIIYVCIRNAPVLLKSHTHSLHSLRPSIAKTNIAWKVNRGLSSFYIRMERISACNAFAVSTCCNALHTILLAAALPVATISLAVAIHQEPWDLVLYWLKTMKTCSAAASSPEFVDMHGAGDSAGQLRPLLVMEFQV
jgi:hypothetical protein